MDVGMRRPLPQLLSVKEYAAWYGVTTRTVYQWVATGAVPVRRVGRVVRILIDDEDAVSGDRND